MLALSAIPGAVDYCTSKASAFAFMESLTLGLLDCPGVSATTVLPFHIESCGCGLGPSPVRLG